MGLAFAAWHWSPQQFWSATPHETYAAYEAWRELLPALQPAII